MDEQHLTLAALIHDLAARRPTSPAYTLGERTLSFADLDDRSSRAAAVLQEHGVGRGDRIAVVARNSLEHHELLLAAAKLRAVLVGINFRLAAAEVAEVIADARPGIVFAGEEQASLVGGGPEVVVLGPGYERWLGSSPAAVAPADPAQPGDVLLQLYSSGTTGAPKGAMLTNANLAWTPRMGRERYRMGEGSVNLLTSPLFHVGGVGYGLTAFGQGAHTVMVPDLDPRTVLDAIGRHRVTHAFLVPTVIRMLLDALALAPADVSSLEMLAYGAAPIDERTLLEAMAAFGCRFLGVYGMTETAGSVTCLDPGDHDPGGPRADLLRSVGRSLPWHDVDVFDPATERPAPAGAVGEIWVRSPQNMAGYWGQPQLTAASLRPDGWLRTGDAAWRDEDGYLFIHDRLKDMIISGGENVYPAEVERVLATHPGVRESIAIGVPHDRWGETVKALVVAAPGVAVTDTELIAHCRERLAHFKCPTSVDFVDTLVRNASGKVLKRVMREPYWRGRAEAAPA